MQFSDFLDQNVSYEIQRAAVDLVIAEYRHTRTEVWRRYAPAEAQDVEPHIRRANIETGLIELGGRFPNVARVASGSTQKGNHYRFLVCGELVLTQSYVEAGRRVPREAVFRNGFAGDTNQMLLDPDAESERVQNLQAQDLTYAIITHTPSIDNPAEPSHVSAVLVDRDCRHVASVNLVEHLALIAAQTVTAEVVADLRAPKLRKDVAASREKRA